MISVTINGQKHDLDVPDEMPLLWVIRDVVGLTGTKFGCGVAQCGCCTVHVGDDAVRSCVTSCASVAGKSITTIEALGTPEQLHPCSKPGSTKKCRSAAIASPASSWRSPGC